MKTFIVSHEHMGELERETVSDCATVEDYMNRKYGRNAEQLKALGLEVTDADAKEEPPKQETKAK